MQKYTVLIALVVLAVGLTGCTYKQWLERAGAGTLFMWIETARVHTPPAEQISIEQSKALSLAMYDVLIGQENPSARLSSSARDALAGVLYEHRDLIRRRYEAVGVPRPTPATGANETEGDNANRTVQGMRAVRPAVFLPRVSARE